MPLEEIEVKHNPLGVKVYINGRPNINNMPEKEYDLYVSSLEFRMTEYYEKRKENKDNGEHGRGMTVMING